MFTSGFLLNITLPTRISDGSATLIDNVFINIEQRNNCFSGALISDISDHLPCFSCIDLDLHNHKYNKYVYVRKLDVFAKEKLYKYLMDMNIMSKMSQELSSDPN